MRRKRALFLINSLAGGGAERVMCTLLRHSEAERTEFEISLAVLDSDPPGNTAPDWVDVRQFDCRLSLARSVVAVRRLVAELQPDITLSFLPRANLAAVLNARAPVVISERAHASHHFRRGFRGAVSRNLLRTAYPRASRIIAVSEGVARDLSENFGVPARKLISIPNPVDVAAIREKVKTAPSVDIGGPYFMSAGRLVKVKNYEMLVRAFAAGAQGRKLVIVGEGEERGALMQLAQQLGVADRLVLPGFLENPYPLMAGADAFILSSDSEGYPNALVEAMAVGRAVISTNCDSGPSEILANAPRDSIRGTVYAQHGVLAPVGDVNAMAEVMRSMTPALCEEYARKATARAATFSAAAIKDRYWNVLREAMNATPTRHQ